jgi:hypothetical protein
MEDAAAGMKRINTAISRVSDRAGENRESIVVIVQALSRFKR